MTTISTRSAFVLGGLLLLGMTILGYEIGDAALQVKAHERSVVVKGLSEKVVLADTVIWPLSFQVTSDDLRGIYGKIAQQNARVSEYLQSFGLAEAATTSAPRVWDRLANDYVDPENITVRYSGSSVHTVYTSDVAAVRDAMEKTLVLGEEGVLLNGANAQFLFTGLNDIKPQMVEESTRNARIVARKFAEDSDSKLGKIKSARQGQFSIFDRDSTTPHIKKVRVVSTIEYYLSD